jgi:hypothetical protein
MPEKTFWASEQGLITTNWTNIFSLMSWTGRIYSKHRKSPSSHHSQEKETDFTEGDQGAL